jgi:hypothetical protein
MLEEAAASQRYPQGPLFAEKFPAEKMKALSFQQVGAERPTH